MKFKIIPIITIGEVKYKIIANRFIFWRHVVQKNFNEKNVLSCDGGDSWFSDAHFDSPKFALEWINENYGTRAEIINFDPSK